MNSNLLVFNWFLSPIMKLEEIYDLKLDYKVCHFEQEILKNHIHG